MADGFSEAADSTDPSYELAEQSARFPDTPANTILVREPSPTHGEVIGKIRCSLMYVTEDTRIEDLAEILDQDTEIQALGVINERGRAVGVVVREELFNLLGRLYGRDVLRNREVSRVLRRTKAFAYDQNIFAVADTLFKDGYGTTNEHYLLVNGRNEFEGVFSTRDLLVYLSEMTRRDVALARALQKRIVREQEVVTRPAFHLISASVMAQEIGGDFYAVREYAPGRWAIGVCDVSGKGIAASLLTSVLGGMFSIFDFSNDVSSFVQELNRYTYRTFEIEKFITGVFLDFDESSGQIVLYDMGHSYLYLRKNGKILKLKSTTNNVPLGVTEDVEPEPNRYVLQPGEALLLFTDGVVDQEDPEGNPYPLERAEGILNRFEHMGFRKMKDMLLEDLRVYRGPVPQTDDITVLMLEYTGTEPRGAGSSGARTKS